MKKLVAFLLVLAVVALGIGPKQQVRAEEVSYNGYIEIAPNTNTVYNVVPGETYLIKIPVRLVSYDTYIDTTSISAFISSPDGLFENTDAAVNNGLDGDDKQIVGISYYEVSYVEAYVTIKDTAKIGLHTANIEFRFRGRQDMYDSPDSLIYRDAVPFYVRVTEEKEPAAMVVENVSYEEALAAVGGSFKLNFSAFNRGEIKAYNVHYTVDYPEGLIPDYSKVNIKIGDIPKGTSEEQSLPIRVLPTATPGLKMIKINYSYKDVDGVDKEESSEIYVMISESSTATQEDANIIAEPKVLNEEVDINSEYNMMIALENIGAETAKDISVRIAEESGVGVSSGILVKYGSSGVSAGNMKAGEKKIVSLPLSVTGSANAGLNEMTVQVNYSDSEGRKLTATTKAYITVKQHTQEDKPEPVINNVTISRVSQTPAQPMPGEELKVDFTVTNNGTDTITSLTLFGEELSSNGFEPLTSDVRQLVGVLAAGESKKVSMKFKLGNGIPEGMNELKIGMNYTDAGKNKQAESATIYVLNVRKPSAELLTNDVTITNMVQSPEKPYPGDTLTVSFKVTNNGNNAISKLALYGEELSANGFEPLSSDIKQIVGEMKAGETKNVTMQFKVGEAISAGMNELKLAATFVDASGTQQKESTSLYVLNIQKNESPIEGQLKNDIQISNMSQSPAQPIVGENVTVSFTVTNNGTKEISNLRFAGANLSSSGFEPISSEVYTNVGSIPAGATKNVAMTFRLGESIPEGFNTLNLDYLYTDGNGEQHTEHMAMYVLNVKNQTSSATSRPKLIIDNFVVSSDELRAGSTFDFTFDLKNTHASKAAKNITVTVYQAQDIFAITNGSNSFYIDAIEPGQTEQKTVNLKVKSDTATGAYDLTIKVAYEYDDMSQADISTGGVTEELPVKLQAVENSRPSVQNLAMGYEWDPPKVDNPTSMMFEFYNMGKSTLDNVYITIDGDWRFESGSTHIIGSVGAGMSSYQEVSVIPMTEGMAYGTLTVHFENSNGDEVTKEFELPEKYVEGNYYDDFGGGFEDYGGGFETGGDAVDAKQPLMPVWVYILSLVAALAIGTFAARAIVIGAYKKKHKNDDEV